MKNFSEVKQKIIDLSEIVGLPVTYKSDLDIYYDALKEYEGEKFLLILRNCGAQLAFLDNKDYEYRAIKFEEFKFYYAMRDSQFYYFDGEKLKAIDPSHALELLTEEQNYKEVENFEYKNHFIFQNEANKTNFYAEIREVWSTDDIDRHIKNMGYNFNPKLTAIDKVQILHKMEDIFDANHGHNWESMDNAIKELFAKRMS